MGDYKGSIADFDQAIKNNPKDAEAFNARGESKVYMKDYDAAEKDFNLAIQINPNYAIAYYSRGNLKTNRKDHRDAIKDYNKAIEIDAKLAIAYYGRALSKLEVDQNACPDLHKAIDNGYSKAYEVLRKYCK